MKRDKFSGGDLAEVPWRLILAVQRPRPSWWTKMRLWILGKVFR